MVVKREARKNVIAARMSRDDPYVGSDHKRFIFIEGAVTPLGSIVSYFASRGG
jgi:hypothetical protein